MQKLSVMTRRLMEATKTRANVLMATCEATEAVPALEEIGAHVMKLIEQVNDERRLANARKEAAL